MAVNGWQASRRCCRFEYLMTDEDGIGVWDIGTVPSISVLRRPEGARAPGDGAINRNGISLRNVASGVRS